MIFRAQDGDKWYWFTIIDEHIVGRFPGNDAGKERAIEKYRNDDERSGSLCAQVRKENYDN